MPIDDCPIVVEDIESQPSTSSNENKEHNEDNYRNHSVKQTINYEQHPNVGYITKKGRKVNQRATNKFRTEQEEDYNTSDIVLASNGCMVVEDVESRQSTDSIEKLEQEEEDNHPSRNEYLSEEEVIGEANILESNKKYTNSKEFQIFARHKLLCDMLSALNKSEHEYLKCLQYIHNFENYLTQKQHSIISGETCELITALINTWPLSNKTVINTVIHIWKHVNYSIEKILGILKKKTGMSKTFLERI